MSAANCPRCSVPLEWKGGTSVSPESVASVYLCPNPDCGVTTLRMVIEE